MWLEIHEGSIRSQNGFERLYKVCIEFSRFSIFETKANQRKSHMYIHIFYIAILRAIYCKIFKKCKV